MAEPITPEIARGRLGITSTHRDAEIQQLISAAREHIEDLIGGQLVVGERREFLQGGLSGTIVRLASRPVRSLTAIEYLDSDGAAQTITDARLIRFGRGWAVSPAIGGGWPADASEVVVVMECGFVGNAADPFPPKLIQAMLVLIAHWFDDPQGTKEIPAVVADLCFQARTWEV